MKFLRATIKIIRGIYDILASYLLGWVLFFGLLAFGFHELLELGLKQLLDYPSAELLWWRLEDALRVDAMWIRLVLFAVLHAVCFFLLRPLLGKLQAGIEWSFDRVHAMFQWATSRLPRLQAVAGFFFSLAVTALLVPFVLQPTLVSLRDMSPSAWLERSANLLDGSASAELINSTIGLYRKIGQEPIKPVGEVSEEDLERGLDAYDNEITGKDGVLIEDPDIDLGPHGPVVPPRPVGKQPMMDRWNTMIWRQAEGDPRGFARIKAFVWVESGGRQYAISHTGCAGLMQFCSGTAKSSPFRQIFGRGQIYACRCKHDWCKLSRRAKLELESGDPNALLRYQPKIACDLSDARFNPVKMIAAGDRYTRDLSQELGGNLYLMYIGYNSGPRIAREIYRRLGQDPNADLQQIGAHLEDVLRPVYGRRSARRARGLLRIHLPKLGSAYRRYLAEAQHDGPPSDLSMSADELRRLERQPTPDYLRPRGPGHPARDARRDPRGGGEGVSETMILDAE